MHELRLICFGGKIGAFEYTNVHGHDQWNIHTHGKGKQIQIK